ncbi:DNA polymerase III subunit delta [Bacillus timonensis]|uniref:DNA polymerase III subunit delta n=1 Tax=Bacillus timonensis TaxID=1033734 RepID=A0A4S3PZK6_9BACI|nr:DNA polymerase III subunit delta [Bacillus timonensis]THE15399.1 DNA polymerase III subunit delta [Bacillus timonensis]
MNLELWKKIKKKQFAPIYLLHGSENFLIQETKELLIKYSIEEEEKDFNLSVFDLEETPVEIALADAETLPFMGERRVVILQNPSFLTSEKNKDKVEHNISVLEHYLKSPAPFTILVFTAPYEKLDERKKIVKLLKTNAEVLTVNTLSEKDLHTWITDRVIQHEVTIRPAAIQELLHVAGTNLMNITQEIDKMCLYLGVNGEITEETVQLLVPRSLEQNIFSLIDKVVNRKLDEALRIFYDLLQNNEEPIKILSLLATQFRLIFQVKELSRQGYGQQQIAGNLKVHPFRVKLAGGQSNLFTQEELLHIMNQLAEADYEIKNGKMDKKLILELFIMKLAK